EALDAVRDRAPVREQSTEPAVVYEGHADARRLLGDCVHGLLLRADEEDRAAALREVARERRGLFDALDGLLEIDDVDCAALAEDEPLHLRVPAARLVAEVHSGFQKLSHADDCHGLSPFLLVFAALLPAETGWNRASSAPAPPPSRPAGSV